MFKTNLLKNLSGALATGLSLLSVGALAPTAQGQAFFDITNIYNGTADGGQVASGYSRTDWPNYNEVATPPPGFRGGADGTFVNGGISGVWSIYHVSHPTIYDGATSNNATPVSTLASGVVANNRNNAFIYDESPTNTASGIEISLSGLRNNNNDPLESVFYAAPTSLTGSLDDPIPVLSVYPTAPAVQTIPTNQWGYGFNVFNHATDYNLSWAGSSCPGILFEPDAGEVTNFGNLDPVNSGDTILSVPQAVLSQDWYAFLPPNVDTLTTIIEGFRYYDVIGFDILYYDTQLSIQVGDPTVNLGLCPNAPDAGDEIPVTYTLENIGDVAVLNPTINDPVVAPVTYVSGDTNTNGELDPGEVWIFEGTYTITGSDYGTTISTIGSTPVISNSEPRFCAAEPVQSEAPRVIEVPEAPVSVSLQKCSSGNGGNFNFSLDNLSLPTPTNQSLSTAAGSPSCSTIVEQCVTDPMEPVIIEETVPAGWTLEDAECSTATAESLAGSALTIPVSDLTPGADINCVFNNVQQVEFRVRKIVDETTGDFDFSTTNSDLGNFTLTASPGSNGAVNGFILDAVVDTTLTETVPGGWELDRFVCQNFSQPASGSNPFTVTGATTVTVPASFYEPGDIVRCQAFNERLETTLTVEKEWGNVDTAQTVNINVSGVDSASASGTSPNSGAAVQTIITNTPVYAGDTITLSETVLAGHTQNIICDTVTPSGTTTATFDVPDNPTGPITCRFINIEYPNLQRWLQFNKTSIGGTGSFDFTAANATIPGGTETLNTTMGNPAASDFFALGTPGSDLVITEAAVPGFSLSTATQCYNVHSGSPVAVTTIVNVSAGTITVPNTSLNGNSKIICDIVNDADEYPFTVDKAWVDSATGDIVTVTTTGNSTDTAADAAPSFANDVVETEFYLDGIVTVDETNLPNYTSALVCDDGLVTGSFPWSIDTNGNTTGINCVLTNTRNSTTMTLTKQWWDSVGGETISIVLNNGEGPFNLTAAAGDSNVTAGTFTVFGGETINLDETPLAGYDQDLTCTGGITIAPNGTGEWNMTMPDTFTGPVSCEIENDRRAGDLTITKQVTNGSDGTFTFTSTILSGFNLTTTGGTASETILDLAPGTYDFAETVPAGWTLTGATCDDGSGAINIGTGQLTGIMIDDGDDVTCTFFNRRNTGMIEFTKNWVDANNGAVATITAVGDAGSNISYVTPGTTSPMDTATSTTFGIFGGETLTLDETVTPAGYTNTGFACDTDNDAINDTTVATGATLSIPLSPPAVITCEIENTLTAVEFTADKVWVDALVGETANFELGGTGDTGTAVAGALNETDLDVVVSTVVPGVNDTVSETLMPNYVQTVACTGATPGTPLIGGGLITWPLTVPNTSPGVECTFTNTRRTADLTLSKIWINADVSEAATITVASTSLGTVNLPATADANATNMSQTILLGTQTLYAGETLSLSETLIPGYTQTLLCNGVAVGTNGSGSIVLPASPVDQDCEWTNSRNGTVVTVIKNWIGADAGDLATISVTGGVGTPGAGLNANATAAGTNSQTVGVPFQIFEGEIITFAETAVEPGYSVSPFTCDSLILDASGTVTVAANPPAAAICEITNTRNMTELFLSKIWVDAEAGVTVNLSASSTSGGVLVPAPADGTEAVEVESYNNLASMTVSSGQVITLSEGVLPAGYSATLICSDGIAPLAVTATGPGAGTITVPNTTGPALSCTWANQRNNAELTLNKTWVDADANETVTLDADGLADANVLSTADATASIGTETQTGLATMTAYANETIALSEIGVPAGYTATLLCDGFAPIASANGSITMPANPADLDCTWTNARNATTVNLSKIWVNEEPGATATLDVSGGMDPQTLGVTPASPTPAVTFEVFSGEAITFAETALAAGYTQGNFVCDTLPISTAGTVTIPNTPPAVANCSITNTRNDAELQLVKVWENPANAITVTPTATGTNGTLTFNATSDADTAIETETYTSPGTLTVLAGETITIDEGSVPMGYDTTLVCEDNATGLTVTAGSAVGSGSFVVPDNPTALVCTWTNTRRTAQLLLNKTWINAALEEPLGLNANGMNDIVGANAIADNLLNTTEMLMGVGAMTIFAGETIALSEVVPAGYDATLTCDQGVFVPGAAGAGTLTVGTNPSLTQCTWTNTRRETSFALVKEWENPIAGATATLEALGTDVTLIDPNTGLPFTTQSTFDEIPGTAVSSTGPSDTSQTAGTITAYAGEEFVLDETALSAGFTAGAWDCGPATITGGNTVTIPDTPGATVSCSITNTRNSVALDIDKQWTDSNPGDSTTITTTGLGADNGISTSTAVDVLDTDVVQTDIYAGETITISETVPAGYDATLVCTGGATVVGTTNPWSVSVPLTQTTDVNCTMTNDRRPTMQISKVSDPSIGTFNFGLTNTTPATATLTTTTPGTAVSSGTFAVNDLSLPVTITEAGQVGWNTTSITCTDQQGPVTANASSDAITLTPADLADAQDIMCEFFNEVSTDDIVLTKTVNPLVASEGEIVTYTITVTNTTTFTSTAGQILDTLPAGIIYVPGSAILTDNSATMQIEPTIAGSSLTWPYSTSGAAPLDDFVGGEVITLTFQAEVIDGETRDAINTVVHTDEFGVPNSVPATALLTILEDPGMVCSTIIGTVYDTIDSSEEGFDKDGQEVLNDGERERGLAGVRLVTPDGQVVTTDINGRYSIPCVRTRGARGAETRVTSVPLKVVPSSLPVGYGVVTNNPMLVTTTPGKVSVANFGAAFQDIDNQTCSVPFSAEEAAEKEAQGIYALFDNSLPDDHCRDTFWFITAQVTAEGDGSVLFDNRTATNGSLTAYFKGYITGRTLLTMSYQARGSQLSDFTSGVLAPDVERILDQIEDEDLFPVFADASTIYDDTPTTGGLYIRLEREDDRFVFGDVEVDLSENSLAPISRDIYGALIDLNWDSDQDGSNDGTSAQVTDGGDGSLTLYGAYETFSRSAEVFTGLGSSSFFLSNVNVVPGSLSAEIRVTNTITGQIINRIPLAEGPHFWVDESGGLLYLNQPLMSFLPGVTAGTTVALYTSYDYIPASLLTSGQEYGGRIEQAVTDDVTVGATAMQRTDGISEHTVIAGDIEWRFGERSYLRAELAQSEGTAPGVLVSNDGGITFALLPGSTGTGNAANIAFNLDGADFGQDGLQLSAYLSDVDAGFSSFDAGVGTVGGTSYGLSAEVPVGETITFEADYAAGDVGGANEETRGSIGASVAVGENSSIGAAYVEGTSQGNTSTGVNLNAETTFNEGRGTLAASVTQMQSQDVGAPDLDAAEISYTQELETGGSVGATVREDATGTEVGLTFSSNQEGPLQTFAELSQQGASFGDLGNAWLKTGFRYTATDNLELYGENRRSLGSAAEQSMFGLSYQAGGNTIGLSALYDTDLNFETTGISASYGWDAERTAGVIRIEGTEQIDLNTGIVRDGRGLSFEATTQSFSPWEASLSFDYAGSTERGGTGNNDAHAAELEAAMAYRTGTADEFVVLLVYKADYDFAPLSTVGASSYNHELDHTFKLDLTYRINPWLTIGGAYTIKANYSSTSRLSALQLDEIEQLGIIRLDAKLGKRFGVVLEGRGYTNSNLSNVQAGLLEYFYFDVNPHVRLSVGYSQDTIGTSFNSLGAINEGWFVELSSQY